MQTSLPTYIKNTHWGETADKILRSCVHCGFCTATCPTYQLLGDELDGPRGRIYQIKQFLEQGEATYKTQQHLDRCLTCRSCETTCPSGVEYGHLLDIGREQIERALPRPLHQRSLRLILRKLFTSPNLLRTLVGLARTFKPLLPAQLKQQIPEATPATDKLSSHPRKMLILEGCVQPELSPEINAATRRVLDHFAIETISAPGCCGAIEHHLSATEQAKQRIKQNIEHWWPYIDDGIEAIISTASGCGVMVKDYDAILADEPAHLEKARAIVERTRDISEIIMDELSTTPLPTGDLGEISFHTPCTLQHGQQLDSVVDNILEQIGYKLNKVTDAHLCCGSAGTYSILQKSLSHQLRDNKLGNLLAKQPQLIATANIGCLLHLRSGTDTPVTHWINLLDKHLSTNS